jgi:prepilin signal peptidase PulO-like enzyme (type II secretory pathway)
MWWLVLAWLFIFGGCVGSFLNVVVYRLPAGLSLLYPGSRCPSCLTPIRAADNVPIFGWLLLAGRCRACGNRISLRYPLVEFATAAVFALFAALEPLGEAANLPELVVEANGGGWTEELLWAVLAFHLTLACGLLCAGLIEYDQHPLPGPLVVVLVLVGVALPFWFAEVRPVPAHWSVGFLDWLPLSDRAIQDTLAALATSLFLGCALIAGPFPFKADGRRERRSRLTVLTWVGLFLGWQATGVLATLATVTRFAVVLAAHYRGVPPRLGWIGCLSAWSLSYIVLWKLIVTRWPFLGDEAALATLLAAAATTAAFSAAAATIQSASGKP